MIKAFLADYDNTLVYDWTNPEKQGEPLPCVLRVLEKLKEKEIPIRVITNQMGLIYAYFQEEIMRLHPDWKQRGYPRIEELAMRLEYGMGNLGLTDIYVSVAGDNTLKSLLVPTYSSLTNPSLVTNAAIQIAEELQRSLCHKGLNAIAGWQENWRKPEPGMIEQATRDLGIKRYTDDDGPEELSRVIYCGDMHSGKRTSDRDAAKNAGVQFLEAERIQEVLDIVVDVFSASLS